MGIKRGVSFYSYQQAQFFRQMNWKDMVRELHDNLKCDGVEIIDEATIPHYPFPSQEFIYDWNSFLARYDMKAVTKDIYLDVHQFRDHVMTHREAAERLKYDIKLAAEMGFENVRCLILVPTDVIEMALPTAEKYNVRIGKEIHAPWPINPDKISGGVVDPIVRMTADFCGEIIELAERTGSKHVGLVPDFGIFQHSPSDVTVAYRKRLSNCPDAIDFIVEESKNFEKADDLHRVVLEKFPGLNLHPMEFQMLAMHESPADPEDLRAIVPYIVSIHGKFYNMTEIEGQPGHFEDKCINYADPIRILNEEGYQGYIDSEYEGQRDQQDRGEEYLADEVEQVRRHHEMLERLIKATPNSKD